LPTTEPTATVTTTTGMDTTTPQQTVAERQPYKNKTDGFSLQFPGDRTFQENVYGASVMFSSPVSATDKIKENVSIIKKTMSKNYTLEEYYTLNKDALTKEPNYTEVQVSTIKVNDLDSKKVIFTYTDHGTNLKVEQLLIIKNNIAYTLTYIATEATFNDYAQKVDEMIATREII